MKDEPIALTTLRFILWLATVNFTVFIYCSYLGQQKSLDDMKKTLVQQQVALDELIKLEEQHDSTLCECRNLLYKLINDKKNGNGEIKPSSLPE